MDWLGIFRFLNGSFLSVLNRSRDQEERRQAEMEALRFIRTQRMRRAELPNLRAQLSTLADLKARPDSEPERIRILEGELALKERLLTETVLPLERNAFNASILEAYAKECEELARIEELKAEIARLEGTADADRIRSLRDEIREKERWLGKDVLDKLWPIGEE